jgi:putative protease
VKRPELLAPAGDFEKLVTAIHYGADAVYLGSSRFSLRHKADNFELEELKRAVQFTHQKGKRAYVTVNIFPHNRDIALIKEYIGELKSIRPDAIIISDPAVLTISKKVYPELPIHISTQANITNKGAALFWESLGVRRLVLSRELTIGEIKEIRDTVLRSLCTALSASLTLAGAILVVSWPQGAPILVIARTPVGGTIPLWKKKGPMNTCLSLRMTEGPIL